MRKIKAIVITRDLLLSMKFKMKYTKRKKSYMLIHINILL